MPTAAKPSRDGAHNRRQSLTFLSRPPSISCRHHLVRAQEPKADMEDPSIDPKTVVPDAAEPFPARVLRVLYGSVVWSVFLAVAISTLLLLLVLPGMDRRRHVTGVAARLIMRLCGIPLTITGAAVRCYPTVLAFHAPQAGVYQLLAGNRGAAPPDYDLNSLRGAMELPHYQMV